jgi:hypothetical protein
MNHHVATRTAVRCLVVISIIVALLLAAAAPSDFTGRQTTPYSQVAM